MATLNDLVERGRTAYQKTGATYFRSGLFTLLLGSVFLLVGGATVTNGKGGEWGYFLVVIGVLFFWLGGCLTLFRQSVSDRSDYSWDKTYLCRELRRERREAEFVSRFS